MNNQEIVISIIADTIGITEIERPFAVINLESKLVDDLCLDSLDILEIVMTLEDQFNIEISDEDVESMKTVGDVVRYISARKPVL